MSNVVNMFGEPIAERVAERTVPALRNPTTALEMERATAQAVRRENQTHRLGTWFAVAVGVGAFFLVRNWRHGARSKAA